MKRFFYVILFFLSLQSFAQLETSHWYFGTRAGLDFTSGSPVVDHNGMLETHEACSSFSDSDGNLLFYTNGEKVWNANHQRMQNGNILGGHESASQGVIIIPRPNYPDLYYIFSVGVGNATINDGSLHYSVVDMSQDGGLGRVTSKKNLLIANTTEKVTGMKISNEDAYWVLIQKKDSDEIIGHKITENGISSPIVSGHGPYIASGASNQLMFGGSMKFSPNGRKLAVAMGEGHPYPNNIGHEIYDFDESTGILSNNYTLMKDLPSSSEFSPNGRFLYVSNHDGIMQFDLEAGSLNDIRNSGVQLISITTEPDLKRNTTLQLALDGKIYVNQYIQRHIGVINYPNKKGNESQYNYNQIDLGRNTNKGLPQFVTSFFNTVIESENFCYGSETTFEADLPASYENITWDFGDGNTSNDESPTHIYNTPGRFTVSMTLETSRETTTENIEIEILMPRANVINESLCSSEAYFKFSDYIPELLGDQSASAYDFKFYETSPEAEADAPQTISDTQLITETSYFYARMTSIDDRSCSSIVRMTFSTGSDSEVIASSNWSVCDIDGDGIHQFTMSEYDSIILDGEPASNYQISYYKTLQNAQINTSPLSSVFTLTEPEKEIFYRIGETGEDCPTYGKFKLIFSDGPELESKTYEVCGDGSGFYDYKLGDLIPFLLEDNEPEDHIINFYESSSDAENQSNSLDQNSYTNSDKFEQQLYVRVSNKSDSDCYSILDLTLKIGNGISKPEVLDWIQCHDHRNGNMPFLLSEKDDEILDGKNPSEYTVSYYYSNSDAEAETNEITTEVSFNHFENKTIYYRLKKNDDAGCYTTGSFDLKVIKTKVMSDEMEFCGNSEGFAQFKLEDLDDRMLNFQDPNNSQDPAIHEVTYYLTEADAENQVNLLNKDQWTNTIPDFQEIYVRIQRTDEFPCYHIKFFHFYINRTIKNPEAHDEIVCLQDNSSLFTYDLNQKDEDILDGANADTFNILYYNSENDAQNRINDITQIYSNDLPKTVFFRVENSSFQGCFETGSFNLNKQNGIQAKEPEPVMICDTEESGIYYFNLAEKDAEIMNGQSFNDYKVAYYQSEADAHNRSNEISKENYECSVGTTSLFAELSPLTEGCSSIVKLEIIVSALPQPLLEENYFMCSNNASLNLDGGDFESWEWLGENYESIGNERTISITEPGDYGLSVTKTSNGILCQNTIFFSVETSSGIGEVAYTLSGTENNKKLNVQTSNSGSYEYSIDGVNFQNSPEFNVVQGNYTIYVKDTEGCNMSTSQVHVPGYQEYFTPNGDGINDEWKIVAFENGIFLDVLIYDRYGKLLAQLTSGKNGWDGNYNGKPMPSDDYWFTVEYADGQIATGHFSLVRS